eukprot:TRINITY_DN63809_c0_g1_i4.p1 TRINITY_DN63809_c0_g1~~TRINITY_DN63809_c0_g1_i4.p1  ORF type:complete len:259 (+),score=13.21 TRINITY_DN63809_c0_g1_i4:183-959(+)
MRACNLLLGPCRISWLLVFESLTVLGLERHVNEAARERALSRLSRSAFSVLLDAVRRVEDEPWVLRRVQRQLKTQVPGGWRSDHMPLLAEEATKRLAWTGRFVGTVILVTGELRTETLLKRQLSAYLRRHDVDLVVLVTWGHEVPRKHWLVQTRWPSYFQVVRVRKGRAASALGALPALGSARVQDILLRSGLDSVTRTFRNFSLADILIFKTRTDAYVPSSLLDHVLSLDYSVSASLMARPFVRKMWLPWVDALQPF